MEEKKIRLIWRKTALNAIEDIYFYIAEESPQNAEIFIERLISFGENLVVFPNKYRTCRFPKYARKSYHCAVFEKNYMFIYKIKNNTVYINMIHHVSRLK